MRIGPAVRPGHTQLAPLLGGAAHQAGRGNHRALKPWRRAPGNIAVGHDALHGELLYPIHVTAAVLKTHPSGRRRTLEITELNGKPLLLLSRLFGLRSWFEAAGNQIGRQLGKPRELTSRPAVLDDDVVAFDIAPFVLQGGSSGTSG